MKKFIFLIFLFPSFLHADRLGGLKPNSQVLLSTQPASGSVTVYPASATASFPFGFSASTGVFASSISVHGAYFGENSDYGTWGSDNNFLSFNGQTGKEIKGIGGLSAINPTEKTLFFNIPTSGLYRFIHAGQDIILDMSSTTLTAYQKNVFLSSVSVSGQQSVGTIKFPDGTIQVSSPSSSSVYPASSTLIVPEIRYTGDSQGVGPTIFLSPTGNDSNTGLSSSSPVATSTKALTLMGKVGVLSYATGSYYGLGMRIDLSGIKSIKIIPTVLGSSVSIILGERLTSGWTQYNSLAYPRIWQHVIVSTPDISQPASSDAHYILDTSTTEGIITQMERHPLLAGRSSRLDNYRLRIATSVASVNLIPGTWYRSGTTLYVSTVSVGSPNTKTYLIPSDISTMSFVYNANGYTDYVEIQGIDSYSGQYGYDLTNVKRFKISNSGAIGNYYQGVLAKGNEFGETEYFRGYANGDDCIADDGNSATFFARYTHRDPLCIGNGDEGISDHNNSIDSIYGGYMYANFSGGITPAIGATVSCYSVVTATNALGFDPAIQGTASTTTLNCYNCHSIGDRWGYFNWGGGQAINTWNSDSWGNETGISASLDAISPVNHNNFTDLSNSALPYGGAPTSITYSTSTIYAPLRVNVPYFQDTGRGIIDITGNTLASFQPFLYYGNALTNFTMRYGSSAQIQFLSSRQLEMYSIGDMSFGTDNIVRMNLKGTTGNLETYYGDWNQYVGGGASGVVNVISSTGTSFINAGNFSVGAKNRSSGRMSVYSNNFSTPTLVVISTLSQTAPIVAISSANGVVLATVTVNGAMVLASSMTLGVPLQTGSGGSGLSSASSGAILYWVNDGVSMGQIAPGGSSTVLHGGGGSAPTFTGIDGSEITSGVISISRGGTNVGGGFPRDGVMIASAPASTTMISSSAFTVNFTTGAALTVPTTTQFTIGYSTFSRMGINVSSVGAVSFQAVGSSSSFIFKSSVTFQNYIGVTVASITAQGNYSGVSIDVSTASFTSTATFKANIVISSVGAGIQISTGTNATLGTSVLSGGTVVVNTTRVTNNSVIFLTTQGGITANTSHQYVSARTAGTSFTISSVSILDASTVGWIIIEPSSQ